MNNIIFSNRANINLNEMTNEEVIEYFENLFKNRVRPVDPKFIQAKLKNYEGCPGYQTALTFQSEKLFQILNRRKSTESKITFILWKYHSICELLMQSGFKGCISGVCNRCRVMHNCAMALRKIADEEYISDFKTVKQGDISLGRNYRIRYAVEKRINNNI